MTSTAEVQRPCFWHNSSRLLAIKNLQDNTHEIPLRSLILCAYACIRVCSYYSSLPLASFYSPILKEVFLLVCKNKTKIITTETTQALLWAELWILPLNFYVLALTLSASAF